MPPPPPHTYTPALGFFFNMHSFITHIADEEPPSITCPDDITEVADTGQPSTVVTWIGPTATDNSGQVTISTDISPGLLTIGSQTITGTAVDGAGNVAQCTFTVLVQGKDSIISHSVNNLFEFPNWLTNKYSTFEGIYIELVTAILLGFKINFRGGSRILKLVGVQKL